MEALHAMVVITAVDRTANLSRQALPEAPTVAEPVGEVSVLGSTASLRHRLSLSLRHLADRIDPSPAGRTPQAGCAA